MLGAPPPGGTAPAANAQTLGALPAGQPYAGMPAPPNMYGAYYRSSYAAPSSMSMPSSIPYQQQYYGPPPDALAEQQKTSMVKALKGAQ